ncbi:MAG TPA: helix-turn-helix transcriptional regulator [Thermoanaerobaculia bacterium]|nr:helix-turn-helix transcriptional regulator [Thermoanaerobaculia bacterium]
MAPTGEPDLGIVLAFLREGEGWSQTRLAQAAGTTPKVINDYEHGRRNLKRPRLEALLAHMAVPPQRIDATLSCLAGNRASARAPAEPGDVFARPRRRIEGVSLRFGRLFEDLARGALQLLTVEGQALHGLQTGEIRWWHLKRKAPTADERRMLVEEVRNFRQWGVVVAASAESIEKAANHPREALELAELALYVAERVPGDAAWRARLAGWAAVHVANGHRVCNDLKAMEASLERALRQWEEGEAGDPGLLDPAVVPWIEAACRRAQRKFRKALTKINDALALDRGELRGKILLTKSGIHKALGDFEASTAALSEAAPLIDGRKEPRLALYLRFNLLSDLSRLGRAEEAERGGLKEVRRLAEQLGEQLDLSRVVWLGGLVAAGVGRFEEAEAAFRQARRDFEAHGLAYDYALVSLDLSLVLLGQDRHGEVRKIAEEMIEIFKRLEIDREAWMALRVFCEAAQQEAATIELTRRVLNFLLRAQQDPGLRFEGGMEGAEAE